MKPSMFIILIAEWIVLKTGKTYTYIPLRHVLLIQQI